MSGTLRLKGSTSGYSELKAPAVAGDQTFILPAVGGDLLTTDNPAPYLTLESGVVTAPSLRFEGDLDTGLYTPAANEIGIVTNANERVRIDSSGDVGIGTNTPTSKLHISSDNAGSTLRLSHSDPTSYYSFGRDSNDNLRINDSANGEIIRIDSSGNVGIGTSNPGAKLSVSENSRSINFGVPVTGYAKVEQRGSSSTALEVGGWGDVVIAADTNSVTAKNIIFSRQGTEGSYTESMRIDSSGNVGIGTSSPEALLDVTGGNLLVQNSVGNTIRLRTTVDNGNDSTFVFQKARGGSGTIADVINGDDLGTISWSGYYGGSYQTNSTIRGEAIIGASYGDRLLYDSDTHILRTNNTSRLAIISDGKVGIGTSSPTELLEAVATNPRLCIRDTQTSITTASATLRLAESGAGDTLDNYWDVVADNTAGNFGFSVKESGVSRFAIQAGNGNVGIGTTSPGVELDVAGEIRASSGILFGTDTAAANALDDYEEGAWTPTLVSDNTSGGVTYGSTNSGYYVKIGNQVTLQCYLQWTANSAGGGTFTNIGGLPFANSSTGKGRAGVSVGYDSGFPTSGTQVQLRSSTGSTTIIVGEKKSTDGATTNVALSALNNTGLLLFTYTYFTGV